MNPEWLHLGPIAVAGVFGLFIVFERALALYVAYPLRGSEKFFSRIRQLVLSNRVGEAIQICQARRGKPVAFVVWQGLLRAHQPESVIQNGLGVAVSQMNRAVQKRTGYLATVANVSTLLGLFGTILGLVQSFQAIGGAGAQQRASLLTAGISTAMNATLIGLGVAIPCLVLYSLLASRTNRHLAEIEEAALRLMEIVNEHYSGTEAPSKDEAA